MILDTFFDVRFLKTDEIYLRLVCTTDADLDKGYVPAYHFTICTLDGVEVGECDFRIGFNENLYYGGNIGYSVYEGCRGSHYAGKACLLLFELARKHNFEYLYITCNPDNIASRKTCEFAGGVLKEIVPIPVYNPMFLSGEKEKCIYKFML